MLLVTSETWCRREQRSPSTYPDEQDKPMSSDEFGYSRDMLDGPPHIGVDVYPGGSGFS